MSECMSIIVFGCGLSDAVVAKTHFPICIRSISLSWDPSWLGKGEMNCY